MPAVAVNKNTNWLDNKAAWLFYILLIFVSWLMVSNWTDPGLAWTYVHIVHGLISYYLLHWTKGSPIFDDQGKYDRYVTYSFIKHRMDACMYPAESTYGSLFFSFRQSPHPPTSSSHSSFKNLLPPTLPYYYYHTHSLTFWEQIDDGVQFTSTRKFFTIVPVALFLLATNASDFSRQPLGINLLVVVVLLIAKLSSMHKVRIMGINKY